MAYPLSSADGATIAGWAGTFYNGSTGLLSKLGDISFNVDVSNGEIDVTRLNASTMAAIPGLKQWSMTASAHAFATARASAASGLVSFSTGGYALHMESAEVELTAPALDITSAAATPPTWRSFRPEAIAGRFRFLCRVDSETSLADLPAEGAALPTLTFKYGEDTADDTLAGSAILTSRRDNASAKNLTTVEYGGVFTGNITPAGTNSLFGSSALGVPEWPQGTPGATKLELATGNDTWEGDAFWTRLLVRWAMGSFVSLDLTAQGTGALSIQA